MRIHYTLSNNSGIADKMADVEIHFEEGFLAGLKLVGVSVWRGKKDSQPVVVAPSRSYASANGVRYYELLKPSDETAEKGNRQEMHRFKEYIRNEYLRIAALPEMVG